MVQFQEVHSIISSMVGFPIRVIYQQFNKL